MVWTLLLLVTILVIAWSAWTYFRLKKAAPFVENTGFLSLMRLARLINLVEPLRFPPNPLFVSPKLPLHPLERS
ncbi:rhodanese-like domain-containing protein, partial [Streptococcus hyovaginalis]